MPRLPVPSNRSLLAAWAVVAIVVAALVAWLVVLAASQQESRADRADLREQQSELVDMVRDAQDRLDNQRATSEALVQQLEGLGEEPVIEPRDAEASGIRPPRVPATPPMSVLAAVRDLIDAALVRVCDGDCTGADGSDGADGTDGSAGADGTDGRPGADSTVPGPRGATGERGPAGADAPRPTFVQCEGLSSAEFVFGYSDGSTITVECGYLEPIPEPVE